MNNIGDFLARRARLNPGREAYVDGKSGLRLTFSELNNRCNQAANALLASGVQKGDRVALLMMNSAEFVELYFALAKIGAVTVPLNWRLAPDELEFILRDSGAKAVIYGEEFVEMASELHAREGAAYINEWLQAGGGQSQFSRDYTAIRDASDAIEPSLNGGDDDLLFIMYTSGTTGSPKGVMHSHNTCFWSVLTFAATQDFRGGDRYLAALPMFHVGSLTPVMVNVYCGVTSVVMREFDAVQVWQLIEKEKITTCLLVPAMLNFMMQAPNVGRTDFSHLRWIQVGAAPVPVQLIKNYGNLGIEIHQIYGLTESCGPACLIDAENALRKIGSTGKAFFHTDVKVADENGLACPPNEHGEVWIRAKHVMVGYWNQPQATAEAIKDGWLRTGDGAIQDVDGYIYMQDRIKDMIISGGENIYPAEIENVLGGHPEIKEVAVIGQPSERWGESPFAIVVRKSDDLTEDAVLRYCESKLAKYKRPCGVAFIDSIPRNPSGKILKRVLREKFSGPAPV